MVLGFLSLLQFRYGQMYYGYCKIKVSAQATTYCLLKILHYEVLRQQGMVLARPSVEDIFEDIF